MKITKAQLKEMIREAVRKKLDEVVLLEQEGLQSLPQELQIKAKEIADKYMHDQARWYALESLFFDLVPWTLDPMEVVSYIYHELNMAAQSEFSSTMDERHKEKAQAAYNKLIDLAQEERLQTRWM